MCEIKVYLLEGDEETLLLESVDTLKIKDKDTLIVTNIFGEKKEVKAFFKEFDNSNSKILLQAI